MEGFTPVRTSDKIDFKTLFPIGSIYMSTSSTNPNTWMKGTTWERYANGRVLVGVSESESEFSTVGKTGGEKTHKLTVSEMPSHNHTIVPRANFSGNRAEGHTTAWEKSSETSQNTSSTGGNTAHNNLQPYISVYIFRRTA